MPLPAADARVARARQLAANRLEARQVLEFYADLAEFQQVLSANHHDAESALPDFLRWLARYAPGPIREYVEAGLQSHLDAHSLGSPARFINEALQQVFPPDPCPHGAPVVSLLREAGHGARRSHICGVCLAEFPAPRLGCVACGESRVERLPVYRTDATDPARVDACDSCKSYLKTIDLTKDGAACPIADDIASVSLDLWAREQGYTRIRPNLLQL